MNSLSVKYCYIGKEYGRNLVGIRYRNVIYYFPFRNGQTYCFTDYCNLYNFIQQRYLPLPAEIPAQTERETLRDEPGFVGIECLSKCSIKLSITGGNEEVNLQERQVIKFARPTGYYVITTDCGHDNIVKKYVFYSGSCYFLYRGALFNHGCFTPAEIFDQNKTYG